MEDLELEKYDNLVIKAEYSYPELSYILSLFLNTLILSSEDTSRGDEVLPLGGSPLPQFSICKKEDSNCIVSSNVPAAMLM